MHSVNRMAMEGTVEDDLREETQIYVCDINPNMLNVGKKRAQERGLRDLGSLVWAEGDAEKLTFKDDLMDGYTIAFGIRNVTHIEKVLAEAYRCFWYSKKGGRFLCLELSHVDIPFFKQLQEVFASMIADARFQKVEYENLVGGVAAIHSVLII
ncbi:putative 2-methoxy-6-polyprenyl-1,4-benzoquinol methylase [Helianthus annuus]|nr:putative 2-methoxy-6-polyprenyl-1,4-benzoquinol methylase [Helianthus annuus]